MGETMKGESAAYRQFCRAAGEHIRMLHRPDASAPALAVTWERFMRARDDWYQSTAAVDQRLATLQILARAA